MRLGNPALISLALAVPLSIHAAAQTPAPQDPPPSNIQTLHVTSREVLVDVIVTDDQGQPVRGLQKSDFTLQENGRPQIIRSFREFGPAIPVAEPAPPVLPRGVYTNSQSTPASGPVQLFLLDALHCNPVDIIRALHSNVTIETGSNQERHTTDWYTIDALNQIAAHVAGIQGRKNLLWITPGMPVDLMRDGGYAWGNGDMTMVHRLMDVYERFTAEQIAVSPIDPHGVVGLGWGTLKVEAVAEDTGGEAFYNDNDLKSLIAKAVDDQSHFYALSYIPPNQKDDAHYHTIKVNIDQPGLHMVYRKGYNAERVPTPDAPAPGPDLLKASMKGDTPARTQLLFDVGVWPTPPPPASAQPVKAPKPKANAPVPYEVHFGFPSSEIAFLEDPDGALHGSLQFEIAAYNVDRKLIAHLTQTVNLPLSPADYDDFIRHPYRFNRQLALPPGELSLHIGILDNTSSKVGTLEIPLTVTRR